MSKTKTIEFCGEKVELTPDNDFAEMAAEAQRQADILRASSGADIPNLLPTERRALAVTQQRAEEVQQEAEVLSRKAGINYPRIDLSFMNGSRPASLTVNHTEVPKFAIIPAFGIPTMVLPDDSRKVYQEVGRLWSLFNRTIGWAVGYKAMTPLPEALQVFGGFRHSSRSSHVMRTARLSFVVPPEAKRAIAEARKYFSKDELFFLAETTETNWKVDVTEIPMMLDPLVIATRDGEVYYITKFDPTAIEDYASREFVY